MELAGLALLGMLIVISPGADFVLVLKNSLNRGRLAGVWSAVGISLAITVHIAYSMLGISYLISQNEWLFNLVRYAGALYLIYLGLKGIFGAQRQSGGEPETTENGDGWRFLVQGFLCNLLNPKTMLFFLSVFSQVLSPEAESQHMALFYGVYMVVLHGIWFSMVAVLFTAPGLKTVLLGMKHRLNQACGAGLVIFGAMLGLKS
ncbi:LysE family translocator [Oceanimonas baumannii]|uniref:Lysine transporter LysE n=1 Tax=Oceanimonas baumannii TaxID=129578 RepID=A0A235CGB7_9GAMM|nr:LysE family transporter [Oceanimonas baumannii]OYD23419.1 lysine transporter LysE [Oceanimonas baumannii]TDW58560.1 RhtB (resistance to homoserine/threonine) family protein [Oceanimonas baumannii]